MTRFVSLALGALALSCAAAPAAAPTSPAAPPAPEAAPDPAAPPAATSKLPWGAPPPHCAEALAGKPGGACPKDTSAALARALQRDGQERDQALLQLESCSSFAPGTILALRAEFALPECRDAVVGEEAVRGVDRRDVQDVLVGLRLSARLRRLVQSPPSLETPHTRQRVEQFVKGPLSQWTQEQARAVHEVSTEGSNLSGYAKAIVAVEAGMADMRFVEAARKAPVPDEIRGDSELTEAYYSTLDQALEPRKARGRDAALVGLRLMAEVGVLHDERVARARQLLSAIYAGRRIDALDSLLLPTSDEAAADSASAHIIARAVPVFYLPQLLPRMDFSSADALRAVGRRGLPASARLQLDKSKLGDDARLHYARLLFSLGRTYWRAADFAAAARSAKGLRAPDAEMIVALGGILSKGPKDAALMMIQGPQIPKAVAWVQPLDALAKSSPSLAGFATYDSARLLEIAAPVSAPNAYWTDVAARYAQAEKKLPPELRATARERYEAARATAKAIK